MNSYRIKYRCGHSGLIKVFTLEANSAEAAMNIVVSDWGGTVMKCEEVDNSPSHSGLQELGDN